MPIACVCAGCWTKFDAPLGAAGSNVVCPSCRSAVAVPVPVAKPPPKPSMPLPPPPRPPRTGPTEVVVVDVRLPFRTMINLIVGFTLALIPAALVLAFLAAGFWLAVVWLLNRG